MGNSINTNIAAYYSQANINIASTSAASSVARLSSGNRIVQASDDVAALSTGTSLQTQVNALKTALTNAAQGTSLLQVADGGLAQIQSILQQQQSLALQAGSGSLTNVDRGFLNQQFQALTAQIDTLTSTTTFNSVNLIDGSLATGGSNNPLRAAAIDSATAALTYAGWRNTDGDASVGNTYFGGFVDTSAGTTNNSLVRGITNDATNGFTNVTVSSTTNDAALQGDLSDAAITVSVVGGTIGAGATGYQIDFVHGGTTYRGTLTMASDDGDVTAGTSVTLTALSGTHNTITLTTGSAAFTSTADHTSAIEAALAANFASATGSVVAFGQTPVITQPVSGNDLNLSGAMAGIFSVAANGTGVGNMTGVTGYTISYVLNDVTYQGTLATTSSGSGIIDGNTSVVLTATTDASEHATITLTIGENGAGSTASTSLASQLQAALTAQFASATAANGNFDGAAVSVTAPTAVGVSADASLYGNLANGSFTVTANGTLGGTITGYTVDYTLNGVTYRDTLDTASTGSGIVSATATLALAATSNTTSHATINLDVGSAFGNNAALDQSANIKAALEAKFAGASGAFSTSSAYIDGQVAQSGLSVATATNNPGQNDLSLVGDLSEGLFTVTGSTSNGYSVSYSINGSTYQGTLNAAEVANGSKLILDNGKGSISFTVSANTEDAPNASTASASTLKTALESTFAGATASAIHKIATTLAKDAAGATIAGSGITAASTSGTLLDGFDGSDVTLQSALFSGTNLPPVSTFSAAGNGSSTVLSVLVDGVSYSTTGTVVPGTANALNLTTFNGGSAGIVTFYKGGDSSSTEKLTLDLSGISSSAKIDTTDDLKNLTDELNATFGAGGSTGGLTFQLGTSSAATVGINIGSAKSSAIFRGLTLDISTQAGAIAANEAVTTAISTVTSLRANVGALESRFGFASAALQSAVQNQDAARSQLLDTDIAAESTAYATQQVKLQAGISVLAQANQQLQALLKLIG